MRAQGVVELFTSSASHVTTYARYQLAYGTLTPDEGSNLPQNAAQRRARLQAQDNTC